MNITKTTPREIILIQRDICEELWKEDGSLSEELLNELDEWDELTQLLDELAEAKEFWEENI